MQEIRLEYTDCNTKAPNTTKSDEFGKMDDNLVFTAFKNKTTGVNASWAHSKANVTYGPGVEVEEDVCTLQFTIPEDIEPPVLFYYHLTNFYQNHRRYVASFFDKQLKGDNVTAGQVNSSSCTPLIWDSEKQKPYYPCGLIANSMFNDTFTSPMLMNSDSNDPVSYQMQNNTNIAWASDANLYGKTKVPFDAVSPPPFWQARYPKGYTAEQPPPDLGEWQAFQVWMRTAGLPTFSKLYQRNDHEVMRAGTYQVTIHSSRS